MGEVNLVEAKTALPKIGNILKKCMTGQYILVFIFLIIILSLPGFSSTSTTQITTSTNSFATNTLFISGKLYDIYTIVMAEKGVYLSAYRKKHTQFNGVNPEKLDNVVTLF